MGLECRTKAVNRLHKIECYSGSVRAASLGSVGLHFDHKMGVLPRFHFGQTISLLLRRFEYKKGENLPTAVVN